MAAACSPSASGTCVRSAEAARRQVIGPSRDDNRRKVLAHRLRQAACGRRLIVLDASSWRLKKLLKRLNGSGTVGRNVLAYDGT
jgi:hypothetical protein